MSSPARRTQRASQSATPRRTSQRSSEAPQSSPIHPDFGPDDQLRSEASQASQTSLQLPEQATPRASRTSQDISQNPSTSSPLFFQSSPANGSVSRSATNANNISSPL